MNRQREFGNIWKLIFGTGVTEFNDGVQVIVVTLAVETTTKTDF